MRSLRLGSAPFALIGSILLACGEKDAPSTDAAVDASDWDPMLGRRDDAGGSTSDAAPDSTLVDPAADAEAQPPSDAGDAGPACPLACQNGGTCSGSGASATCTCPAGFTGALCADDIDECAATPSPCPNPGSYPCRNFPGGFSCLGQTADWPIPRREYLNNDYASQGLIVDRSAGTILDEVTGLMWQRTIPTARDVTQTAAAKACADLSLAGHDDWRLPSALELSTLHTTATLPNFPAALFDGVLYTVWTSRVADGRGVYVTSEPYPYGGIPVDSVVSSLSYLCVRTDHVVAKGLPADRFDTSTQGLVTDRRTRLTWQRTPEPSQVPHAQAQTYCADLELGGHSDFRLPSYAELLSTCDEEGEAPHCGAALFGPNEPYLAWFWTDTVQSTSNAPFRADYVYVRWMFEATSNSAYVRCVRSAD